MIWPLLRLDLRRVLPVYLVPVAATIGFILITRDVLDSSSLPVIVFAIAQGWFLAWRIFRDSPGTRSFIFSRPCSPSRIFWNRYLLALSLQGATLLVVFSLLAAGVRSAIYARHLPYFPMVQPYELSVLRPLALASLITFHIVMFLLFRGTVAGAPKSGWKAAVSKIVLILILLVFIGGAKTIAVPAGSGPSLDMADMLFIYAVLLFILCTAASHNCCKNMEIES